MTEPHLFMEELKRWNISVPLILLDMQLLRPSPQTAPTSGKIEYHQYPIASTNILNSYGDFKKGRRQLRNPQSYSRDQSYSLRGQLKDHWTAAQNADNLGDIPEEPQLDPVQPGAAVLPVATDPGGTVPTRGDQEPGYEIINPAHCRDLPPPLSSKHAAAAGHKHKKKKYGSP